MKSIQSKFIVLAWVLSLGLLIGPSVRVARAQAPAPPAAPARPAVPRITPPAVPAMPELPEPLDGFDPGRRNEAVRIGQDYTLLAGDTTREVVVISGIATIEGHVRGDVTVVLGGAHLAGTAVIDGSLVVVGGGVTVAPGGVVGRDLVIVGGGLEAPPGFTPGGRHVVLGQTTFSDAFMAAVPWVTRGLLLGRPIVPGLGWVWRVVAIFFCLYLVLSLVFLAPVRACADTLAEKPLTTFLTGLLVFVLAGPVSVLMAVSVIGLAVVPFLFCALLVAWIVGKAGVFRWIGGSVFAQESPESRVQSIRSFAIGFLAITLAYIVPLIGFVVWAMVGVFGLGAASLAFITALRRERPQRTAPVRPIAAPPIIASAPPASSYAPSAAPFVAEAPPGEAGGAGARSGPPPMNADLTLFPRAEFIDRFAAFALDVILVVMTNHFFGVTVRDGAMIQSPNGALGLLLLAYFVAAWTWKGTTIGGIICHLRVVRVDGAALRFVDALVRGLSSLFSLAVLGIGCLWILRDPERQAWHDKIAGTYVVKVPGNWPLP